MTADNDNPLSPEGGAASSEHAAATMPVKKSPRRKVAVRPKASVTLAEGSQPAVAVVEEPAKAAPRSRRKKVVKESSAAVETFPASDVSPRETPTPPREVAPAPAAGSQARILSQAEISESPVPEAQVETRAIPQTLMREIEKRSEQNFPRSQPAVAPARQPPARNR